MVSWFYSCAPPSVSIVVYGWIDGCARTNDVPEEISVVHPFWNEMALFLELTFDAVEDMLLAWVEVSEPTWERLVVWVCDALWEGTDAGRL